MVVLTYSAFGDFIGSQSPYAQPHLGGGSPPVGANVALLPTNFTTPTPGGTTIRNNVDYVWDFRHVFPSDQEPGDSSRALKVQNYRIIKAILIPYTYNRHIESRNGGVVLSGGVGGAATAVPVNSLVSLAVTAHLLIGYTFQSPTPMPAVAPPGTGATAAPYQDLGTFIRDQTPLCTAPILDADTAFRNTLEVGVSWLSNLSAFSAAGGGPRLKSTSDNEMDAIQEQQCFHWDFAADYPPGAVPAFVQQFGAAASPAPASPQYPPAPPAGVPWLRNWQVSKAIRATYHSVELDPRKSDGTTITVGGEILVGLTGGGGM